MKSDLEYALLRAIAAEALALASSDRETYYKLGVLVFDLEDAKKLRSPSSEREISGIEDSDFN